MNIDFSEQAYWLIQKLVNLPQCIACNTQFIPGKFLGKRQKSCSRKCGKKYWQLQNRDKVRQRQKELRKLNPERSRASTRKSEYKRQYNLKIEDYDKLLIQQNFCCIICKSLEPGKGKSRFSIDHNHETGKVRGLLCMACNQVIGRFKEDAKRFRRAAEYLKKYE